jgi:hypothetical protein
LGDDAWFKSTCRTFLFLVVTLWKKIIVIHANGTHRKKESAVMVKANIVQILDFLMTVVNVGRTLKMSKISVLYMAINHKDAHEFLTWLIDKTRSDISIVRFDRKRYVLETDRCVVGTFILNDPCRGRALRNSADFFLQSNKPFEARLRMIKDLYYSSLQGIEELGIDAKEITEEQLIKLLIYGDVE